MVRASAFVIGVFVLAASGCGRREEPPPQPQYRPTATVKDIMTSIIDPEADVLWNSVATIVSLTGTEERAPQTDEEWAAVRRSAVQLVEATNLLRIPHRLVAKPGEKSENPRIELQPETIQKMIAEDQARWAGLVDRLHDAAVPALKAIEEKNAKGLFDAGEHLEQACEACHQQILVSARRSVGVETRAGRPSRRRRTGCERAGGQGRNDHRAHRREGHDSRQRRHPHGDGSEMRCAQCREAPGSGSCLRNR